MSYTRNDWRHRYSERSDLSTSLVHLTKSKKPQSMAEMMFKILDERKLIGSTTDSGFIVGSDKAVCFQDAPIHAVCQNCWFEQKLRKSQKSKKVRYSPSGFLFHKQNVFQSGGRPVVYDSTAEAKKYLPKSEWWRIVNFDLSDSEKFIDWTHEREWRVKGDFEFELSEVTLLFTKTSIYQDFIKLCDEKNTPFYKSVAGIVVTESVLF
ncbi:hypothetical protein ABXV18_06630 [Vibrio owensii]|uniref:hypothetical protein n=1 Tax=Vibrio TaxID=662 RepID=UPI001D30E410|nr:hypothetical protein [Vibrio parahaemolyticus]HDM8156596.1 hypothetical protein [Vibrio harveyi]HDM8174830.1 hypothetical protein [Vibrio harveyi]